MIINVSHLNGQTSVGEFCQINPCGFCIAMKKKLGRPMYKCGALDMKSNFIIESNQIKMQTNVKPKTLGRDLKA